MVTAAECQAAAPGWVAAPFSTLTSLAFVLAATLIWLRRRPGQPGIAPFAGLVAGIGIGSLVSHGTDLRWEAVIHDVPLLGTLAFVAADAVADLSGRPRRWWWWAIPTMALVPVAAVSPLASTAVQIGVAAVAIPLTLWRAVRRPLLRRPIAVGMALLAVGSAVGTLTRASWPLCDPTSPWQGHGIWHVLAAAALVALAGVIDRREPT